MKKEFLEKFREKVAVFHPHTLASSADNEWAIVLIKHPEDEEETPIVLCDNPLRGAVLDWCEMAFVDYHSFPLSMFVADEKQFYAIDEQASRPVIDGYIRSYRNLMDMLELAYEKDEDHRALYEEAIGLFNERIDEYMCVR